MEYQASLEATDEDVDYIGEDNTSKDSLAKLLESRQHITQLTERCTQLVGNNTILEKQVNHSKISIFNTWHIQSDMPIKWANKTPSHQANPVRIIYE